MPWRAINTSWDITGRLEGDFNETRIDRLRIFHDRPFPRGVRWFRCLRFPPSSGASTWSLSLRHAKRVLIENMSKLKLLGGALLVLTRLLAQPQGAQTRTFPQPQPPKEMTITNIPGVIAAGAQWKLVWQGNE